MHQQTAVIKIGGSTVDSEGLLEGLAQGCQLLREKNIVPIIVHGGGKAIARELAKLNQKPVFVQGMRVTDQETMDIVTGVLCGLVNKKIVSALAQNGVSAIGISGADAGLFRAKKLLVHNQDIGQVGQIAKVDPQIISVLTDLGKTVVVAPVSLGVSDNKLYNVNADVAAAALAQALKADNLLFLSDVDGVFIEGALRTELRTTEIETYIESGEITAGMIPKLQSCMQCVEAGVKQVHICKWETPSTLINQILGTNRKGTVIHEH